MIGEDLDKQAEPRKIAIKLERLNKLGTGLHSDCLRESSTQGI